MECQSRILPGQQGLPQKGVVCERAQRNKSLAFLENGKMHSEAVVHDQVSHLRALQCQAGACRLCPMGSEEPLQVLGGVVT